MGPCPKALGPTFPLVSALTSTRPSARNTAAGSDLPASWGLTLTLGRFPRGPSQGALRRHARDPGRPSPRAGLTLQPPATRAARSAAGHSGGRRGRVLQAPDDLRRPPQRQNLWAHGPARQLPPLARRNARYTARGLGLMASWGLSLTQGGSPRGPSEGAWRPTARDWGPETQRRIHPAAPQPWAARGPAGYSGGENGQGPLSPQRPSKAPAPKCLGPGFCSPAPSLRPPLHSQHSRHFGPAGILLANPNPRSVPERPITRGLGLQRWGLGTPETQGQTNTAAPPPPGPLGALPLIRGRRTYRALPAPPTRDPRCTRSPKRLGPRSH